MELEKILDIVNPDFERTKDTNDDYNYLFTHRIMTYFSGFKLKVLENNVLKNNVNHLLVKNKILFNNSEFIESYYYFRDYDILLACTFFPNIKEGYIYSIFYYVYIPNGESNLYDKFFVDSFENYIDKSKKDKIMFEIKNIINSFNEYIIKKSKYRLKILTSNNKKLLDNSLKLVEKVFNK